MNDQLCNFLCAYCTGDAKNLGKGHSTLRDGHCTITLDQEEIFRTATIEKAIE